MDYLFQLSEQDRLAINKNWGWFFAWGIALVILGLAAISATTLTTLISVIFLGFIIFIGGVVIVVDSFTSWWQKWGGFFLHIIVGLLYLIVGFMLINYPVSGSISLTLILGIFYIFIGIFRIAYSLSLRLLRWKWNLLNGIISLLLGLLIIANWPASSLFIIGLFVGIDLIFCGWAYIMAALSARSLAQ